jgi:hypothetical protein
MLSPATALRRSAAEICRHHRRLRDCHTGVLRWPVGMPRGISAPAPSPPCLPPGRCVPAGRLLRAHRYLRAPRLRSPGRQFGCVLVLCPAGRAAGVVARRSRCPARRDVGSRSSAVAG